MTYLDTHAAVYLYTGNVVLLSENAKTAIDRDDDLLISPMVLLELQYLHERKRILRDPWREIIEALEIDWGIRVCHYSFPRICATAAESCGWTGDPFDRIIVAHAMANNESPLVTQDRRIRRNYRPAIW